MSILRWPVGYPTPPSLDDGPPGSTGGVGATPAIDPTATQGIGGPMSFLPMPTGGSGPTVTPVPLPAAVWSGLVMLPVIAGAHILRRRRSSRVPF
jgi:hypothetical protein